ncbi:MAG: glycosyltransferase [Verrucomicrobia bacterium]|nr:glycosyltransferase [Verrucomicrobiota bacterium]
MSEQLPKVSIVIAAPPDMPDIPAAHACDGLDYPADKIEIIIARGRHPSVQRNKAVKEAAGEFVYFLDDDSEVHPGNLKKAIRHFSDPTVAALGGPNICPDRATALQKTFAAVMGSFLAFGPSRSRYRATGRVRYVSEKELILCNLIIRRRLFLEAGGFDEALYPNEENALLDDFKTKGYRLMYDPDFVAERLPRNSVGAFIRMLFNYGRGRAEQFRLHPTPGSSINFIPPAFCAYLIAVPFLPAWRLLPLAVYIVAVFTQALALTFRKPWILPGVFLLITMTHLMYGIGFFYGLTTQLKKGNNTGTPTVTLERIGGAK